MCEVELVPGRKVGGSNPCFVIAEIGQNHQGDIKNAKALIKTSKESGADCVKFQKSCMTAKFNRAALQRPYVSKNSFGATYGEHKEALEFTVEQFKELQAYAAEIGIPLTASGMDPESVTTLVNLNVPFLKIGSGDSTNLPVIRKAALSDLPLIISTGMAAMDDVLNIHKTVKEVRKDPRLVMLQCVSSYPTPPNDTHLRVIETMREALPGVPIGYSGHEVGFIATLASVALGAKVVERHVTLNKTWKGSDHACSLEPQDLRQMVDGIRTIEAAMGSSKKTRLECEMPCYLKLGKTIVATRPIAAGVPLKEEDLIAKVAEPKGIQAEKMVDLVGRKLLVKIADDESILWEHVAPK